MNNITNLFGGLRIFIGLLLLSFGCFLDFSGWGIGTGLRFMSGLMGAYLIIGYSRSGFGYVIGMIWGLILYTFAIRSGIIFEIQDVITIDYGMPKIAMRIVGAFLFILGLRDVKEN
jgi:hypothetical protein